VAGRASGLKKLSGEVLAMVGWSLTFLLTRHLRGYLSGVRCKSFAYGSADATATPSSLAPIKSRMVYLFGAGLPRLSWKKAVKWT